jgi:hypothetical protein
VCGRENKGILLNGSIRGNGMYMSVAFRRLRSGLRCACVCHMSVKDAGACP